MPLFWLAFLAAVRNQNTQPLFLPLPLQSQQGAWRPPWFLQPVRAARRALAGQGQVGVVRGSFEGVERPKTRMSGASGGGNSSGSIQQVAIGWGSPRAMDPPPRG